MSEVLERPVRTLSFLTGDGDNTYAWEPADDVWVLPMIQKKIDDGYDFWIVRRVSAVPIKIRTAEDARDTRKVIIKDADARILFEQGRIGLAAQSVTNRQDEFVRERRATSAADAVQNDSVAVPKPRGG